jgi:hypothetical protein
MKRLPETVSTKVTELFAVVNHATDDLKQASADAVIDGRFSQVEHYIQSCRRLQTLGEDIQSALNRFESSNSIKLGEQANRHKKSKFRTRKPGGRMRVKLANRTIEETTIAETFLETLKAFGLERVAKLNKVITSIPLVARTQANGYQTQRHCNGWYITTHVNKVSAKALLEEIANALNMAVKVEFVER